MKTKLHDDYILTKIAILALGLIMFIIVVVSLFGRRPNSDRTSSTSSTLKRGTSYKIGADNQHITQLHIAPNIGTFDITTHMMGANAYIPIGIYNDGQGYATMVQDTNNHIIQMAVSGRNFTDTWSGPLAPVGTFGFPQISTTSYIAYGPYVPYQTSLPSVPYQISGASYATGCSVWTSHGTASSPYRTSTGVWRPTEIWMSQIQPSQTWAMVTSTGAQNTSGKVQGYCSGTTGGKSNVHIDLDVVMSCLPIGLMSMAPYPANTDVYNTPIPEPVILIGLGVLGNGATCPTKNPNTQPMVYLWYYDTWTKFQPCSTKIYSGVQSSGTTSTPYVSCMSTGAGKVLTTMSAIASIASAGSSSSPTCQPGLNMCQAGSPSCVIDSILVTASCNKGAVVCDGVDVPQIITANSFVSGQIISIQAQGHGYVQILPNYKEQVNTNASYANVLADSSYQFLVGNVGSSTLPFSSPPAQLTVATLQSVKYPDFYLSVTPRLIEGGEYGQFTASIVTANFTDYSLEFIQNDANTMFWTQNGTGWWGGGLTAFVSLYTDNSTLAQSGGGGGPSPFIFMELPIPFCNDAYTTPSTSCSGGYNNASTGLDACLSQNNYMYGQSCISGYGACGYPIPGATDNFITLGFKTVSIYMYVWGYDPTTVDDGIYSHICRCKIMYDTTTDKSSAGPNTYVEIDTTFGGNSTGWYSIAGSIDFLDVVNFGYGPLVIWSATTNIVDRMAQLSTVTIQIMDHSTYAANININMPNTIPISLFTRDTTHQAKIISYKETLENTWIPMLTGCLCTTTPRGIWLIGDVLQKNYGIDPRFSTIDQSGQQYFELFISDQLLFTGPPGVTVYDLPPFPSFSSNLNSTAAANGCWIATLEHLPAGINPVCVDGTKFVSADNITTPRPVFPAYKYLQYIPADNTLLGLLTVMNTGPMSPFTIGGSSTGFPPDINTTTYLGIMGVGNPSGIIADGGGMRVPHWLQLDAVPERPDSVNTCDDFPHVPSNVPWQVRHYLYTVTSLYIDPAGVVTNEPVGIKYTPTTNLWDLSCGLSCTAATLLFYYDLDVAVVGTDQTWPSQHWFIQHVLESGSPQVVKSVSLSCTLTDMGPISILSSTCYDSWVSTTWPNFKDYPCNLFPIETIYSMRMSFTTFDGYNHINTLEYTDPNGMAGDILKIQTHNVQQLWNLTSYRYGTYVAYDTFGCHRFDGALAQIILGTYACAGDTHFLPTWAANCCNVKNLLPAIHALQFMYGNQNSTVWNNALQSNNSYLSVCNQTFFMPGLPGVPDVPSEHITTITGMPITGTTHQINSLDCMTFNTGSYDKDGNPWFNYCMVMYYTAEDLTTRYVLGDVSTYVPGMINTVQYHDNSIPIAMYSG